MLFEVTLSLSVIIQNSCQHPIAIIISDADNFRLIFSSFASNWSHHCVDTCMQYGSCRSQFWFSNKQLTA